MTTTVSINGQPVEFPMASLVTAREAITRASEAKVTYMDIESCTLCGTVKAYDLDEIVDLQQDKSFFVVRQTKN